MAIAFGTGQSARPNDEPKLARYSDGGSLAGEDGLDRLPQRRETLLADLARPAALDVAEPLEIGDHLAHRLLRHPRPLGDLGQPRAPRLDEAEDAAVARPDVGVALVPQASVELVDRELLHLTEQRGKRSLVAVNLPVVSHRSPRVVCRRSHIVREPYRY